MIATTQAVRCVEGCGGGEPSAVAIIGLALALFGLGLSIAALREAIQSRRISAESLDMVREEHQVFLQEMRATADFDLTVELDDAAGNVFETTADQFALVWRLGIKNSGEKAANDVGVNFLIPQGIPGFAWRTARTDAHTVGAAREIELTPETLTASDGTESQAQYLAKKIDRIDLRTHHVLRAEVTMRPGGAETFIPVKFKVWADELPDEVEARWITREFVVGRSARR